MKDAVTCSAILEELKRYQDAWLDLDLYTPAERSMGKQRMELWELREGAFVEAFTHTGSRSQSMADTLQFIPIDTPSLPSPVRAKNQFNDFTHDVSQELVVLVSADSNGPTCARIHICSTIDGLPHPLALRPVLSVELAFAITPSEPSAMTVDVTGSLLVTKFAHLKSHSYEILIWDWQVGVLLNRIGSRVGICDIALLDRTHLVLYAADSDPEIGSGLNSVSLIVYNNINFPSIRSNESTNDGTPFNVSSYPVLDPVATFHLPKLNSTMTVVPSRFLLRSDPTPGHSVYTSSVPFACSNMVTLALTLSLTYTQNVTPHSVSYRIFVSASQLLDHLEKAPMVLPWSEWGESATRWFVESETSHRHDWICWMSAGRYIRAMSDGVSGTVNLSVMDFCTPRIRKYANRSSSRYVDVVRPPPTAIKGRAATFEHRWIADHRSLRAQLGRPDENQVLVDFIGSHIPTTVALGLEEEVVSRLPYRSVTKLRSVPVGKSWLIDGSHIIGSDFLSRSGPRPPAMTVYKLKTSSDHSA